MPPVLPEGVTILSRPAVLVNIPDADLDTLLTDVRALIARCQAKSLSSDYLSKQSKGIVGEFKSARHAVNRLFPGAEVLALPRRANGVDILDVLLRQPDGSFVIIESKFQTGGGKVNYAKTNGFVFDANEAGHIVEVPVQKKNLQLSHQWIQDRITELAERAKVLAPDEARAFRRLSKELRQALATGRIHAVGMATDSRGHLVTVDDRTRELKNLLSPDNAGEGERIRRQKLAAINRKGTEARGLPGDDDVPNKATPIDAPDVPKPAVPDAPKLHTRAGGLANRFEKLTKHNPKFTGNIILEVSKLILFGILRGKLSRVNQRMVAMLYAEKVYRPLIEPVVTQTVEKVKSGEFYSEDPRYEKEYVYIAHSYDVFMNLELNTVSDAIVVVGGGLEVPETVGGLEHSGREVMFVSRRTRRKTTLVVGKKRPTDRKNVVRYNHARYTLVHTPHIRESWLWFNARRDGLIDLLNATVARIEKSHGSAWVARGGQALADMINRFEFSRATTIVDIAVHLFPAEGPAFRKLQAILLLADVQLETIENVWSREERALLAAYLGADPFPAREELKQTKRDLDAQQRWEDRHQGEGFNRVML